MSQPFITSVRVESAGAHERVSVWIRGALVGTLTVGPGDGIVLQTLLVQGMSMLDTGTGVTRDAGTEQCERSFLPADGGHSPNYRDGISYCGYCGKVPKELEGKLPPAAVAALERRMT